MTDTMVTANLETAHDREISESVVIGAQHYRLFGASLACIAISSVDLGGEALRVVSDWARAAGPSVVGFGLLWAMIWFSKTGEGLRRETVDVPSGAFKSLILYTVFSVLVICAWYFPVFGFFGMLDAVNLQHISETYWQRLTTEPWIKALYALATALSFLPIVLAEQLAITKLGRLVISHHVSSRWGVSLAASALLALSHAPGGLLLMGQTLVSSICLMSLYFLTNRIALCVAAALVVEVLRVTLAV